MMVAVVYGILHDLVTAHVAVEYFSIHHAKVIESDHPVALALVWGFLATFWVGIFGGLWLVLTNLVGPAPPLKWQWLRRGVLLITVCCLTAAMAVLAIFLWLTTKVPLGQRTANYDTDRRVICVALAHGVSYFLSALFALGLGIWVYMTRKQLERRSSRAGRVAEPQDP